MQHPIDHRLVALAKRAFRVTTQLRRDAFLDHIRLVMGCSQAEALNHFGDLAEAGVILVSGQATGQLVFPGAGMDTDTLLARGVDVRHRA